jgi:hypothetical protein
MGDMPTVPFKRDDGGPIPAEWNLRCLQCGYGLTGLRTRVCPECGTAFSPRQTWEANQAGQVPEGEKGHVERFQRFFAAGLIAALIALAYLVPTVRGRYLAGYLIFAAVIIFLGELWIYYSIVPPIAVRIMVGAICVLIAMAAVL